MERINVDSVNLADLLPLIPSGIQNDLPFGLIRLDARGVVLEYNMAEGDLTGVDPSWAIGKNFFKDVASCTNTPAFYGRFAEGVKKGFLNVVFDYSFTHRETPMRVTVRMITMPDHLGRTNVVVLVKRADRPVIVDAVQARAIAANALANDAPGLATTAAVTAAAVADAPPGTSIAEIVAAVVAALNQNQPANFTSDTLAAPLST